MWLRMARDGPILVPYDQDGREVDVPVSEVKLIGLST